MRPPSTGARACRGRPQLIGGRWSGDLISEPRVTEPLALVSVALRHGRGATAGAAYGILPHLPGRPECGAATTHRPFQIGSHHMVSWWPKSMYVTPSTHFPLGPRTGVFNHTFDRSHRIYSDSPIVEAAAHLFSVCFSGSAHAALPQFKPQWRCSARRPAPKNWPKVAPPMKVQSSHLFNVSAHRGS